MSEAPDPASATPEYVPLSQSTLWQLQSVFYERLGRDAWRAGFVPEYITSNPFIADVYAQMVTAYWRDLDAQGKLNPGAPLYLVELGAGSGRFAYLFLRRLSELLARWAHNAPTFVYIMTDVAQANLHAWRENTLLAPFVEAGKLDFARFDAVCDDRIETLVAGTVLDATPERAPGVVIANYVFDSIPSDLYYVEGNTLYSRNIGVTHADGELSDQIGAGPVEPGRLTLAHTHTRLDPAIHQPNLADLLSAHVARLDNTVFPLPVAGLHLCQRLARLFDGMLMLVGDKGYTTWAGLQAVGNPEKSVPGMAFHSGCFSVMVNFPALARAAEAQGGMGLLPDHEPQRLGVGAFVWPGPADDLSRGSGTENGPDWPGTRQTFARCVAEFGPDDFYVLAQRLEGDGGALTLAQVLAMLRWSRWDPQLLAHCVPALLASVDTLDAQEWQTLAAGLERTAAHDYPSTTRYDLAYGLAQLYARRGDHVAALGYFELSHARQGPNTQSLYEMAVSQLELERLEAAQATLAQVLQRAPGHMAARDLHRHVQRKLNAAP